MQINTGITRAIDGVGRVVIPKSILDELNIKKKDKFMIISDMENQSITLKLYKPGCYFCGSIDNLVEKKGVKICPNCIDDLRK
jgi:transcriptional pleiotropic regulator of transition state genes